LQEHFEKHGAEVNCSTPEEYLAAANAVVENAAKIADEVAEFGKATTEATTFADEFSKAMGNVSDKMGAFSKVADVTQKVGTGISMGQGALNTGMAIANGDVEGAITSGIGVVASGLSFGNSDCQGAGNIISGAVGVYSGTKSTINSAKNGDAFGAIMSGLNTAGSAVKVVGGMAQAGTFGDDFKTVDIKGAIEDSMYNTNGDKNSGLNNWGKTFQAFNYTNKIAGEAYYWYEASNNIKNMTMFQSKNATSGTSSSNGSNQTDNNEQSSRSTIDVDELVRRYSGKGY